MSDTITTTSHHTQYNVSTVRRKFPALRQQVKGIQPVYFDNPGGTQVPKQVIGAIQDYLIKANCNRGGAFHTSQLTDEIVEEARAAMADLLNAASNNEIVFGPNMTSLTFQISRALGRTLSKGDELIVTHMDHDANISPWLLIARDHDLEVKWVEFNRDTGYLDLAQMENLITGKTKLIACVYASNALGTINDIGKVTELAHAVGALTYIDAVQYAPHGPIDVQALDCDFLVCSAYKFFGPHVGILYGKHEHLESLPAYKVRPAHDETPDRWETGTQNHEGLAGVTAAVEHLAWIGEKFGPPYKPLVKGYRGRRRTLKLGYQAIKHYEQLLSQQLIEGLSAIRGVTIKGITALDQLDSRVPTVIFNIEGKTPRFVAEELSKTGIYVWDGNYYALAVMELLGTEQTGGMVRVGAAHYNTPQVSWAKLDGLPAVRGIFSTSRHEVDGHQVQPTVGNGLDNHCIA
jgi:cysteine desulfurase family protein (TIGR01976 family)